MSNSIKDTMNKIDQNIFSIILFLGITQAWVVNVLKLSVPILTFFLVGHIVIRVLIGRLNHRGSTIDRQSLCFVFLFILLITYGIQISLESYKQVFYLLNIPLVMFWVALVPRETEFNIDNFFRLLLLYCLISFGIYFLYWDYLANIIYKSSTGHLWGLKTSGIPRSFGLILNPLSNAYILLIGSCFYLYSRRKMGVYFLIFLFSLALSLVRLSMISMVMYTLVFFIFEKKYGLLLLSTLIFLALAITIDEFRVVLTSILTLSDSKGSIQLHINHFFYGLNSIITHPWGRGITDEHIESWIFRYTLDFGVFGLIVYLIWLLGILLLFLLKKKSYEAFLFASFIPVFVGIPFHEFNVPLILFFLLLRLWTNKSQLFKKDA